MSRDFPLEFKQLAGNAKLHVPVGVDYAPGRNFGIISRSDVPIPAETVLFSEHPLVSSQYAYNRRFFITCSHCMKSVESPRDMLARLSGVGADQIRPEVPEWQWSKHGCVCEFCSLPEHEDSDEHRPFVDMHGDPIPNRNPVLFKQWYCSEDCRSRAWTLYHAALCPGNESKHPTFTQQRSMRRGLMNLEQCWMQMHVPQESASIFLLVKLVGWMVNRMDLDGWSPDQCYSVLDSFQSNVDSSDASAKQRLLFRFLSEETIGKLSHLAGLFRNVLQDPRLDSLFSTPTGFEKLWGLMALNGQGIGTSSLEHYQRVLLERQVQQTDANTQDLLDHIEMLEPMIEEHSAPFTHAEGTGLYLLHSKLNHSCEPNAQIRFVENSDVLQVVALREIQPGEAILISYLDLDGCFDCDDPDQDVEDDQYVEEDDDHGMEEEDSDSSEWEDADTSMDLSTRQEALKKFYLFDCLCSKCVRESQASLELPLH